MSRIHTSPHSKASMLDRSSTTKILSIVNSITGINLKKIYVKQCIDKRLYLLDIDQSFYDSPKYSFIRGSILDLKEGKFFLKCDTFPKSKIVYTPLINKKNTIRFYKGYDGCTLRVFRYGEKIYYSTNRNLDAKDSRIYSFKDSRTFEEILRALNKDQYLNEIFTNRSTRDMIHLFLIVSKETYLTVQGEIEEKVIYLGSKTKYSDNPPIIIKDIEEKFDKLEDLTIQQANKVLGFSDPDGQPSDICNSIRNDKRLDIFSSGFVIKENRVSGKRTFFFSESYIWRRNLVGLRNSNKMLNVFIDLRKYLNNLYLYKLTFPYIIDLDKLETKEYPDEISKEELEDNLVKCLYLIVPKHKKQEALEIRKAYKVFIDNLLERLDRIKDDDLDNSFYGKVQELVMAIKDEKDKSKIKERIETCDSDVVYTLGRIFGIME